MADLAVFLLFWFCGGFGLLDERIRSLGLSPVWSGIVYIGLLVGAGSLITLPFSWYGTFVIEARFGFNRTTPRLFIIDRLKVAALALALGLPLLAGILAFFEYAGVRAWLWCWLAVSAVMLVLQVVVPAWIMPLFNRFVPLADGELKEAVMAFARENRFPLANVFVMDGSRRSAKSNAFFAGMGAKKRLVLFDTLIHQHSPDEIVAIVAHEIGHYKKRHLPVMTALSIMQTGVMFYLLSWFISWPPLFDAFFVARPSVYAGLVFFSLLYGVIDFFAGLALLYVSRRHEYAADRFAAETTGTPGVMATALKRLSRDNLSNLTPHPFYVFLHYSHPPVTDRIAALIQT
jgi:STE24 endopeptidase